MTPSEVFAWMQSFGSSVVAAIDAPLIAAEARRAEALMARVYGSRGVYAYTARPDFLQRRGIAGGLELGGRLAAAGWNLDPKLLGSMAGRHALEVFPHAVTVALLGAPRSLKYKKGPRSDRLIALVEFQRLLREHAAVAGLATGALDAWLLADLALHRGAALKAHEDQLDAIACAFAGYQAWRHGPGSFQVFGDASDGYIVVPIRTGAGSTSDPARSSP